MNNGHDVKGFEMAADERPHETVGAGQLSAAIWKFGDERGGWQYHFNIFRMSRTDGCVTQQFVPRDVIDLAKLVQVLAFTIGDDGCLSSDLRDDLLCLSSCLDDVLGKGKVTGRAVRPGRTVVEAVKSVVEFLRELEAGHFVPKSKAGNVFCAVYFLEKWLACLH